MHLVPICQPKLFILMEENMQIGKKIKKARELRDMSQTLLGDLVGLDAGRVRTYEACIRNPKESQLKAFADSLSIPEEYFTDHKINSLEDAFMILFELEEMFGLSVQALPTTNSNGEEKVVFALTTDNLPFNLYLEKWYLKKQQLLQGEINKNQYDIWCARLKKSVQEDMQNDLHRRMIRQIEKDKKEKK